MSLVYLFTVDALPAVLVLDDIVVFRSDFKIVSLSHDFSAPVKSALPTLRLCEREGDGEEATHQDLKICPWGFLNSLLITQHATAHQISSKTTFKHDTATYSDTSHERRYSIPVLQSHQQGTLTSIESSRTFASTDFLG
jgi:hypothetical protein